MDPVGRTGNLVATDLLSRAANARQWANQVIRGVDISSGGIQVGGARAPNAKALASKCPIEN
eukprot:742232-Lingulodinium_polyedra.AAC.1